MKPNGNQTVLQGAIILTVSTVIVKIIGALFKIPLANILGGVGMSYFVSAYDVLIPVYSMTVTGLGIAVSRMVSERGIQGTGAEDVLRTARWLFLAIGTLASVLLLLLAGPLTTLIGNPSAVLSVCCIAPSVLFSCLSSAYRGYFQGKQDMLPTARSQVVEAIVKLIGGISLAWFIYQKLSNAFKIGTLRWEGTTQEIQLKILQYSAAGAVAGVSISTLCGLLFIRSQYRCNMTKKGTFLWADVRDLWRIALPIALTSISANLTTVIDLSSVMNCLHKAVERGSEQILQMYAGCIPPEVTAAVLPEYLYGSYSGLAVSIFNLVPAVTAGIGISAIPVIARCCAAENKMVLQRSVESVMATTAAVAFPAGFGIFTFSGEILSLLYPHQLMEASIAAPTLCIMGLVTILIAFAGVFNNILQASGMETTPLVALLIGGIIKIVTNIILVSKPEINIHGVAYGSLLCYSFIVMYCAIRWFSSGSPFARPIVLIKPFISAVVCCLSARYIFFHVLSVFGKAISLLLAIAAGGLIYVGLLFWMKFIKSAEICLAFSGKYRRK